MEPPSEPIKRSTTVREYKLPVKRNEPYRRSHLPTLSQGPVHSKLDEITIPRPLPPYINKAQEEELIRLLGDERLAIESTCGYANGSLKWQQCMDDIWNAQTSGVNVDQFDFTNPFYRYLAAKVYKKVNIILAIDREPNYRPENFGLPANFFAGNNPEIAINEITRGAFREIIGVINAKLSIDGFDYRFGGLPTRSLEDVWFNLRRFFDEMAIRRQEREILFNEVRKASLLLGEVTYTICPVCREGDRPVNLHNSIQWHRDLEYLKGDGISLNDPTRGIPFFNKFGTGGERMGDGSMLMVHFPRVFFPDLGDEPYYLVFVYRGRYSISGPHYRLEQYRLPRLFIEFLQSHGIISIVGVEMYSILRNVRVVPADDWI